MGGVPAYGRKVGMILRVAFQPLMFYDSMYK